jgi:hypothetical protein
MQHYTSVLHRRFSPRRLPFTITLLTLILFMSASMRAQSVDDSTNEATENFFNAKHFQLKSPPDDSSEIARPTPTPEQIQQFGDDKETFKINLLTNTDAVSAAHYKPLNGRERWQLYLAQTYTTPGAYTGVFFDAMLDQASRQPAEWGAGAAGFSKRLAFRFGTNILQNSMQSVGAALLKEDPRYIRSKDREFFPPQRSRAALQFSDL